MQNHYYDTSKLEAHWDKVCNPDSDSVRISWSTVLTDRVGWQIAGSTRPKCDWLTNFLKSLAFERLINEGYYFYPLITVCNNK